MNYNDLIFKALKFIAISIFSLGIMLFSLIIIVSYYFEMLF